MSTFLFIVAGLIAFIMIMGLFYSIKNRDGITAIISTLFLLVSFVPAYFGYMQMELTGVVEDAKVTNTTVNEFGTTQYEFTVWVRNEDGEQDKVVWWGIERDSRFARAANAINPDVENALEEEKTFDYKRYEIQ